MINKTHVDVLKELKVKKETLEKQLHEEAKLAFSEMSKELFSTHSELIRFKWRQYTPYFNDGAECVFNAHTEYPTVYFEEDKVQTVVNKLDQVDEEDGMDAEYDGTMYENGKQKTYVLTEFHKRRNTIYQAVITFLTQFDEDDFKEMFGDHAEIIVGRKKVVVEGYEHD